MQGDVVTVCGLLACLWWCSYLSLLCNCSVVLIHVNINPCNLHNIRCYVFSFKLLQKYILIDISHVRTYKYNTHNIYIQPTTTTIL